MCMYMPFTSLQHAFRYQRTVPRAIILNLDDLDPVLQPVSSDVACSVVERFGVGFCGDELPIGSLATAQERVDG